MKSALILALLSSAAALQAQTPAPAAPPAAEKPKLTEAQVNNVLTQLKDLEKAILAQRGMTLSSILDKLAQAIASDQAAVNFYTDCDVLVNSERKEGSKAEARQRAEQVKANMERKGRPGGKVNKLTRLLAGRPTTRRSRAGSKPMEKVARNALLTLPSTLLLALVVPDTPPSLRARVTAPALTTGPRSH